MKPIIKLQSSIGNSAVDQRGKIFSFLPQQDIKEFVYIETIKGYDRGHHYHPEFDEYIVLTKGKGKFVEKTNAETRDIFVEAGECVLASGRIVLALVSSAPRPRVGIFTAHTQ